MKAPVPPRTLSEQGISIVCMAIALGVAAIAVAAILTKPGANVTTLIRMEAREPIARIARQHERNFSFVRAAHYDGVYYYGIALDPLASGRPSELMDLAAHRYGHPGYGWLAWLASAGNPRWVPEAMLTVSLLGIAVAAYLTSLLSRHLGLSSWGGLVIALNPGLVFSVTASTSEAVTAGLLAAALYCWFTDRKIPGAALLAFLCFFKFQMILVPIALMMWELISLSRTGRRPGLLRAMGLLAPGPVLFVIWTAYLIVRFGELPLSGADSFLSPPFTGFLQSIRDIGHIPLMDFQSAQLAEFQIPFLTCVMVAIVITVGFSARLRHPMDAIYILQGGFLLLLNWWTLIWPKDLIRMLAIPLPLWFAVWYLARQQSPSETAPAR